MEIEVSDVIALLNTFRESFKDIRKEIREGFDKFYDTGLSNYLNKSYSENISTKTFLHPEGIQFYDTFYPMKLTDSRGLLMYDCSAKEIFRHSPRSTIIGTAGSGKSLIAKHIFLQTVKQKLGIPILITLRDLNHSNISFEDFLYDEIFNNRLYEENRTSSGKFSSKKKENAFEKAINEGVFVFILDGYDEIYSNRLPLITKEIRNYVQKNRFNKFIITSRPGTSLESLNGFKNLFVKDLEYIDIDSFIKKQLPKKLSVAEEMTAEINSPENNSYRFLLKNPLLLAMFITTYSIHPEMPKKKSQFYWNVFDTYYTKHDSSKEPGFKHERLTFLQKEDFIQFLDWFSFHSYCEGVYSFSGSFIEKLAPKIFEVLDLNISIEDLVRDLEVGIGIFVRDGQEYIFPHRSIQEYFSADFLSKRNISSKKKFYSDEFEGLSMQTSDPTNFWSLCLELDKNFFLKYFLLPKLSNFLNDVKKSSDYEITKAVLSNLNIVHTIRQYSSYKAWDPVRHASSIDTKLISLIYPTWLNCFEVNNWNDELGSFTIALHYFEGKGRTHRMAEVATHSINYHQEFNKELYIILKSVNIPSRAVKFVNTLDSIVSGLKLELKNQSQIEMNLFYEMKKSKKSDD
ncbi:NACHT domain-containing protein [Flavobacteriaceae bacterium MAR_2009_75]|nr:NACHT domain-containing protein [Flavobacteriaceae bacterium MAR_2009_75]